MKIYHWALLFLIFFLAVIIKTDVAIGKLNTIVNEKKELTASLNSATTDAVSYLAESGYYGADAISKYQITETFYTSLYSSLGIIDNDGAKTEIEKYIPVILLCDTDGYYVYYFDDYKDIDGITYLKRLWSEKMPYYYQDEYFIYRFTLTNTVYIYDYNHLLSADQKMIETNYYEFQNNENFASFRDNYSDCILLNENTFEIAKKTAIINQLEDTMSYYVSNYNSIAHQNGISYNFSFPAGQEDEWAQYMDDVNLMVVFQGYPYGKDGNYVFNKISTAGANVTKKDIYYVEQKSWYYLAHIKECDKLKESTTVLEETFSSTSEVAEFGAYCCECIKNGARVPDIN